MEARRTGALHTSRPSQAFLFARCTVRRRRRASAWERIRCSTAAKLVLACRGKPEALTPWASSFWVQAKEHAAELALERQAFSREAEGLQQEVRTMTSRKIFSPCLLVAAWQKGEQLSGLLRSPGISLFLSCLYVFYVYYFYFGLAVHAHPLAGVLGSCPALLASPERMQRLLGARPCFPWRGTAGCAATTTPHAVHE